MMLPAYKKNKSVRAVAQFQSNTAINAILSGTYVGIAAPRMITQTSERQQQRANDKFWTLKRARLAVEQMRLSKMPRVKPTALFRGTRLPWPTTVFTGNGNGAAPKTIALDPAISDEDMLYMARCGAPIKISHPLSCTSEFDIAREFADAGAKRSHRRGWVHVISTGLDLIDIVDVNATMGTISLAEREKEFILLPVAASETHGLWMHLVSASDTERIAEWKIVKV